MFLSNAKAICFAGAMLATGSAYATCPTGTAEIGELNGKSLCKLSGVYTDALVLTNDNSYVLSGGVFVGDGEGQSTSMTIQAGTTVYAESGADFLVIQRGSKIFAEGTREAPIVFTAARTEGRTRGEWGGLVLNGYAPINNCGEAPGVCEAQAEGNAGLYGGNDPFDNSGVLRYVRIEFAGFEISPENELNGLSLQGVGAGTVLEYIQVHMAADDGIEWFGGTVNAKYVLVTGARDDSLDWVNGWNGKVQYAIVKQFDDEANHGIEADNLSKLQNAEPRSNPTFSNLTILASDSADVVGGDGMRLRAGTGASFYNAVVTGAKTSCINVDDAETFANGAVAAENGVLNATGLTMVNSVSWCPNSADFKLSSDDLWSVADWFKGQEANRVIDPALNGWVPAANSPLLDGGVTPFDLFFDEVDFIGGVRDAESDWTVGWTTDARS